MLVYILKVHLLLAVSVLLFNCFLRAKNQYHFNRHYLIISTLLAIIAPFFTIGSFKTTLSSGAYLAKMLPAASPLLANSTKTTSNTLFVDLGMLDLLSLCYLLIALLLLTRYLSNVKKLVSLCKVIEAEATSVSDGIIFTGQKINPFSFLGKVYLPDVLLKDPQSLEVIKKHELTHVNQFHSWDIIIVSIINAFFYLNPFQKSLMNHIQENHEYLADQEVIKNTPEQSYIKVLIQNTVHGFYPSYVNHFSKPFIFKRLTMIKQKAKTNYISIALSSLLFMSFFLVVGCEWSTAEEDLMTKSLEKEAPAFTVVEEQAIPTLGIEPLYASIGNYMNSSLSDMDLTAEDEGVCYIQFTIEKDGSLTNISCVKGINPELNQIAIKALEQAGEWNPGKQDGQAVRSVRIVPIRVEL